MTPLKRLLLTSVLAVLSITFAATAVAQTGTQQGPVGPVGEVVPPGWQRYNLDGGNGSSLNALLPGKPEDFGVANLKRPSGEPLTVRIHMLAADAKTYFVAFIDLPKTVGEMSDKERGEAFYGCWMALASKTSQALEQKFGAPFPITPSDQMVGQMPGGERRKQDFKVGTQSGRAQAMLIGRRAYMVAAIWDARPDSEKDAVRFLNSFQVKPGVQVQAETKK